MSPLPAWCVGIRRVDGLLAGGDGLVVDAAFEVDDGLGAVVAKAVRVVAERLAVVVVARRVGARSALAEVGDARPPPQPGNAATAMIAATVIMSGRLRSEPGRRNCRSLSADALIFGVTVKKSLSKEMICARVWMPTPDHHRCSRSLLVEPRGRGCSVANLGYSTMVDQKSDRGPLIAHLAEMTTS